MWTMQLALLVVLCTEVFCGGYNAGPVGVVGGPQFQSPADFNPLLLQGQRGYPGIRARINQRAFEYASGMLAGVLNQEIKKARIPPINQCIPQVNGCVQIYNLYVSRYRCPQRVVLYPAPPNRIILQVQNVDIGVTGNLGGQITVLLPLALTGIVQLNIHQATITVDLSIDRGPNGPYLRVNSCNVHIGYADAYIENGGLIGDIVNSQFRSKISGMVKQMIPGQICGQLPSIVNEKINSKLSGLPQSIGVSQMLSMFGGALGLGGPSPSNQYCSSKCSGAAAVLPSSVGQVSGGQVAPAPLLPTAGAGNMAPQIPTGAYHEGKRVVVRGVHQNYNTQQVQRAGLISLANRPHARRYRAITYNNEKGETKVMYVPVHGRSKRQAASSLPVGVRVYRVGSVATAPSSRIVRHNQAFPAAQYSSSKQQQSLPARQYQAPQGYSGPQPGPHYAGNAGPRLPPPPPIPGAAPVAPLSPAMASTLCNKCPAGAAQEDPVSLLKQAAASLDFSKLNDLYLTLQLQNTHATTNDFTVDLSGEFSPGGRGGTPFGAFPTAFPTSRDNHMAEFILSDYTINSLFYWMHRKQFLTFRLGPETPKIGELLKTTCSDDEDDFDDFEATEVELDEEEEARRLRRKSLAIAHRLKRGTITIRKSMGPIRKKDRKRRQDDVGGLADLGICFGDILPAVREKYPNEKIAVQIHTVRAPSVILSARQGGMAILDLVADADIYIDGTNNKVGTITIAAVVEVVVKIVGPKIIGNAQITTLKLSDGPGTLGLPQDALDNLGNLGKELLQKIANDALGKGIDLNIPSGGLGGLPINIINPQVQIVEHGLYIATDLTVSPSLLGINGGGSC